jgi:hypothetical protein
MVGAAAAARLLGCTTGHVYVMAKRSTIPHDRTFGRLRFPVAHLLRVIAERAGRPRGGRPTALAMLEKAAKARAKSEVLSQRRPVD